MHPTAGIDLKLLRVRAGLRQYAVAQRLGIPPSTLRAMENGRRPLDPGQAHAIATAISELAAGAHPEDITHGA